jgi:hypothetical protein
MNALQAGETYARLFSGCMRRNNLCTRIPSKPVHPTALAHRLFESAHAVKFIVANYDGRRRSPARPSGQEAMQLGPG